MENMGRWISLLGMVALAQGCFPAVSRTNAKLTPGWSTALVGSLPVATGVIEEPPDPDDPPGPASDGKGLGIPNLGIHIQRAWQLDNGSGIAVQAKIPGIANATLDVYYQVVPIAGRLFVGLGAEASLLAQSAYLPLTLYISDNEYITLTASYGLVTGGGQLLWPQVAFGYDGEVYDVALSASYGTVFNGSLDTAVCLGGCANFSTTDFALFALSVQK